VILTVPKHLVKNYDGTDRLGFEPQQQNSKIGFAKWVKNPSKALIETGKYYPRLTGIKRIKDYSVKIEFSAPKLLYGNNLEELEDKDFNKIIDTLYDRLLDMDVVIDKAVLAEAKVSAIHYSKNIEMQNGYTSQYVIRELRKANKRRSFDNTDFRYSNDGQSIQIYSKSHSLVIYDKIADLQKNDKRSIDNENKIQRGLFDELEVKPEIVRIEVRLSEYRKLKKTLDEIGFKEDVKFNRMFSEKLSQKITKLYWDMVTENSKICFLPTSEPKQILEQIAIKFPKSKPFKKLQMVAMVVLANSGNGITELRNILFKGNSDRSWYRIVSDYKTLTESLLNLNPRDWYKQIEEQLENYKKINIKK
jgi:hypothetical protein